MRRAPRVGLERGADFREVETARLAPGMQPPGRPRERADRARDDLRGGFAHDVPVERIGRSRHHGEPVERPARERLRHLRLRAPQGDRMETRETQPVEDE